MRKFFRRLSLPKKLILIGVIPIAFLCYLAFELYNEKDQKVELLELYTQRIYQSENLARLIDALQNERKLSFDLTIKAELGKGVYAQRRQTDSLVSLLRTGADISMLQFEKYTFVDALPAIRQSIDAGSATSSQIMDTYTNMIFRLNTLNTSFPASSVFMKPVANDLAAQRLLTEMQTYLGIIRSNIFNVLHSKSYVVETLIGTHGVYKILQSYEREFNVKAPPGIVAVFNDHQLQSGLKPTLDYIDSVFKRFNVDTTYDAETWWMVSNNAINGLRVLQQNIWNNTKAKINSIIQQETRARNQTLVFLIIAIALVAGIVAYTIIIIGSVLNELKHAAGKIARGDSDVSIPINSDDAIGSLASSISIMEKQVRERTIALRQSNAKLESSNKELEQFAYVASHDLQEPVRKIRTFADQLKMRQYENLDDGGKKLIDKIAASAERMKRMITDILEYAQLDRNEEEIKTTDLDAVINNVTTDLELLISQKNAVINKNQLPTIQGIPIQLNQLFYNLLNNALKFSKDDVAPVISIHASDAGKLKQKIPVLVPNTRYVLIEVADNGIGFSQEYAQKIFDMFQRLTTERSGTGIGLALCKKIVENHKGYIEALSEPGKGTTFRIVLPTKQS